MCSIFFLLLVSFHQHSELEQWNFYRCITIIFVHCMKLDVKPEFVRISMLLTRINGLHIFFVCGSAVNGRIFGRSLLHTSIARGVPYMAVDDLDNSSYVFHLPAPIKRHFICSPFNQLLLNKEYLFP